MTRPAAALALCLAAAALLAAGCGGTSKEEYEDEVDKIGSTLEDQLTTIGRDIQASGGIENAAPDIERGAGVLDDAANSLDDVEPPDDAAKAHDRLVAGVRAIARDFRTAAEAAEAGDRRALLELVNGVETSAGARQIELARKQLRRAGYAVED